FTQEKTPLDQLFEGQPLFLSPKPGLGLKEVPFLTSTLAAMAGPGVSPTSVLRALAPKLKTLSAQFSTKRKTGRAAIHNLNGTIDVEVKAYENFDIVSASFKVVSNTHFLSLALTLGSILGISLSGTDLSWKFIVGLYLAYEALLFFITFAHEVSEIA